MSKYGHRTGNWFESVINKMGGEAVADAFQRGEYKLVRVVMNFLRYISSFIIPARTTAYNPVEFFKTRDGLHVWGGFVSRIMAGAVNAPVNSTTEKQVTYYDLVKPATDAQIGKDLGGAHVWSDVVAFRSYLASLIQAQWGGKKDGHLLVNGFANLFYVRVGSKVFTVSAAWSADDRGWLLSAYPQVDFGWYAGSRVFSGNEPSEV